jgi:hypothetical protein
LEARIKFYDKKRGDTLSGDKRRLAALCRGRRSMRTLFPFFHSACVRIRKRPATGRTRSRERRHPTGDKHQQNEGRNSHAASPIKIAHKRKQRWVIDPFEVRAMRENSHSQHALVAVQPFVNKLILSQNAGLGLELIPPMSRRMKLGD